MAVISGGTTLIDNGTLDAAVPAGKMTLLATQTASASATISFTSGIDSTYDLYCIKFINVHGGTDDTGLRVNFSSDGGSNYNVTKTTTFFRADHKEDDSSTNFLYGTGRDLAQSTGDQPLDIDFGADNDQCCCGELYLYNPSSTTFVKHFIAKENSVLATDGSANSFVAGYCNTTSAIDAVQFKMSSGNIDSGVIKLYGIGG